MFFLLLDAVCGIWTQEEVPETQKPEPEKNVILEIQNITIHPKFIKGQVHIQLK
jgi:hypothetical protein